MKVLLLNPLGSQSELEFCDIGLGYLASALRDAGHDVTLLLRAISEKKFRHFLSDNPHAVVGIKVLTPNAQKASRTIELIRDAGDASIIIGGPHVSGDPLRVLDRIHADYAMQGEGDRALAQFLAALDGDANFKDVPGLIYHHDGELLINAPDVIHDVSALPFPAWDLMPPAQYSSLVCRRSPAASILSSRGCTNRCHFCAEANKRLRQRTTDNIIEEIRYLVNEFGVREIQFLDSNFIAIKKPIIELCNAILDSGLDLAFCAPNGTRLEAVDEEVCALLARIGFYRVNLGIESGSREVLKKVHKASDLAKVPEKVAMFRKHGIQVIGNFMLGFPGETREQLMETLDMALRLNLTGANFSIYVPMPGTTLYNSLVLEGKLPKDHDFANYDYVTYCNDLSELTPEELASFRNRCVYRFLLRPRTIKTMYDLVASGIQFRSLARRLYGMYIAKYLRR